MRNILQYNVYTTYFFSDNAYFNSKIDVRKCNNNEYCLPFKGTFFMRKKKWITVGKKSMIVGKKMNGSGTKMYFDDEIIVFLFF
jgi:hypothetical protein